MAVANAVPLLKQRADFTTAGRAGEGVSELIAVMIADDLASLEPKLARHRIPLGDCDGQSPATLGAYGETVLMTGGPEAGRGAGDDDAAGGAGGQEVSVLRDRSQG